MLNYLENLKKTQNNLVLWFENILKWFIGSVEIYFTQTFLTL